MKNNIHKKITEEDKFSRRFACWAQNHRSGAWRRYKKGVRRSFRRICKKYIRDEMDDPNYWIGDYTPYKCPNPYCNKYSDNATKYCPHCGWRIKPKG